MFGLLGKITEILEKLVGFTALATTLVELGASLDGAKGEEKKARAIALLKQLLPPNTLPGWLAANYDQVAGVLIDLVVATLNRLGFFQKSGS